MPMPRVACAGARETGPDRAIFEAMVIDRSRSVIDMGTDRGVRGA
jgi:hypothetical protein